MTGTVQPPAKVSSRLESFVDAAFAFAVTLLVISVGDVPRDASALIDALRGVPAFAASFALLAMLWWSHAEWSRRYGLRDATTTLLSLLLVFLVLVYVYPLRLMFSSFFAWMSGGALSSDFAVRDDRDMLVLFTAYAVAWTTLGCTILALYRHSWRRRDALGLDAAERVLLRGEIAGQALIPVTGLLSLLCIGVLALAGKPNWVGLSGFAYALMALTGHVVARGRRRAAVELGQA